MKYFKITSEDNYYRWDTFFMLFNIFSEPIFFYLILIFNLHIIICRYIESKINFYYLYLITAFICFSLLHFIIYFPLNFLRSYYIEKKFSLSNQSFNQWLKDYLKINTIKALLILFIVLIIYTLLRNNPEHWWIIAFVITSILYIFLAGIAPLIIFPLFFKFSPLNNEELKNRLINFIQKLNLNITIQNIYEVDLSKKTNAANAAIMGFGTTRRIALSDTLINQFSPDEIEAVLAHELGHLKNKHHIKGAFITIIFLFFFFLIADIIVSKYHTIFNIDFLHDPASMPLFSLIFSITGILILPILNSILRRFEFSADLYSATNSPNPYSIITAFDKLATTNLIKKEPNRVIETLFYSHPSIKKRIDFIKLSLHLEDLNMNNNKIDISET